LKVSLLLGALRRGRFRIAGCASDEPVLLPGMDRLGQAQLSDERCA